MAKKRIAILGIGAVGGYFGGLLAERYKASDVEIIFIARERSIKAIRENGLKIITPESEKLVRPHLISNDPAEIGEIDYLICCVKSYDLAESLSPLKSCIHQNTIVLPLLNGVDSKPIIQSVFPGTTVWEGCVYIVARLTEPGVITKSGGIASFHFGSHEKQEQLKSFHQLLLNAGIDAHLSENILKTIWEKFVFISVVASITSYLNLSLGPIRENDEHRQLMFKLFNEIVAVSKAKSIDLSDDIIEKSFSTVMRLSAETTSSMHSDFMKGGKTEYRSLTEYVVKEAERLRVDTPEYRKILEALKSRASH